MQQWLNLAQVVAPLALGIVAFFLGGLNERKRDERTLEREDIARKHLQREAVDNERHGFQRETLLSLQESLIAVARIGFITLLEDRRIIRETGTFGMLPEEIGGIEARNAMGNFNRLAHRILDESLRADLLRFSGLVSKVTLPPVGWESLSPEQAAASFEKCESDLSAEMSHVQEALGVALRLELARTAT